MFVFFNDNINLIYAMCFIILQMFIQALRVLVLGLVVGTPFLTWICRGIGGMRSDSEMAIVMVIIMVNTG